MVINWNGKSLLNNEVDLVIVSDVSNLGWGVTCQGQRTGGPWSPRKKSLYIICLNPGHQDKHRTTILLRLDNTSAVAYINNRGGTVSQNLVILAKNLWMWCLERNIHITAQHLPKSQNTAADEEYQTMVDR